MNRRWARIYIDMLDNPKIAKLSSKCFKFLIFLLLFCSENKINRKTAATRDFICWRLRISEKDYNAAMNELFRAGIVYLKNNKLYGWSF